MPNYESYFDVLSEHAAPRNVLGGSAAVILTLAALLFAVSLF